MERFIKPLFHNFKAADKNEVTEEFVDLWHQYIDTNAKFVQTLVELKKNNDHIWIHDYHLLLVPVQLRKKDIITNIGFYFHSPFPSSDVFKFF